MDTLAPPLPMPVRTYSVSQQGHENKIPLPDAGDKHATEENGDEIADEISGADKTHLRVAELKRGAHGR
jgi:hypothetical protein